MLEFCRSVRARVAMLKIRTDAEKWRYIIAVSAMATVLSVLLTWVLLGDNLTVDMLRAAILGPLLIAPPACLMSARRSLEIYRLNQRLEHLLAHDQMTNLLTRSHFMRQMHEMESDFRGSFLMLDIDLFKKVNDTYGHLVGDEVIRQVAGVIQDHVRRDGLAARYGGEEFVVCLPQQDMEEAVKRAEEIRQAVERKTVKVSGANLGCTISIGLGYADGRKTVEEVLKRADEALYVAKKQGRNRVSLPRQEAA